MHRVLIALLLAGCIENYAPIEPQVTSHVAHLQFPVRFVPELDLLFVIDSSPSMRAHRENLARNFRELANVLGSIHGGLPSLRIAVVSSDLGTTGARDTADGPSLGASCAGRGYDGRFRQIPEVRSTFIEDLRQSDGTRLRNYDGPLADVLAKLADVGDSGCELSQPLEAMRRALIANPTFERRDAHLAVIFLTAQDDCTFAHSSFLDGLRTDPFDTLRCYTRADRLVGVDEYVSFLKGRKLDRSMVQVGVASGPAGPIETYFEGPHQFIAPACSYEGATAAPAPRLHLFREQFPNRNTFTSLCQPDLTGVLPLIGGLLGLSLHNPCFESPLADVDDVTPGEQFECAAWYSSPIEPGSATRVEATIPSCDRRGAPCWRIEVNQQWCPEPSPGQLFSLVHEPSELPRGTIVTAQCVTR